MRFVVHVKCCFCSSYIRIFLKSIRGALRKFTQVEYERISLMVNGLLCCSASHTKLAPFWGISTEAIESVAPHNYSIVSSIKQTLGKLRSQSIACMNTIRGLSFARLKGVIRFLSLSSHFSPPNVRNIAENQYILYSITLLLSRVVTFVFAMRCAPERFFFLNIMARMS